MGLPRIAALASTVTFAAVAVAGAVAASSGQPSKAVEAEIAAAAVAPYRALGLGEAGGLCTSLTAAATETLLSGHPPGTECLQAVEALFEETASSPTPRATVEALEARPHGLTVAGSKAEGTFELVALTASVRNGTPAAVIHYFGTQRLKLEEQGGRWLVSSPLLLAAVPDCAVHPGPGCDRARKDLVFTIGGPLSTSRYGPGIPTPLAVQRGGPALKSEYTAGRTVMLQSGCLACHKIGEVGNPGPGQNLTHVGSHLSPSRIERAIIHGKAPMPSFGRLPKRKLRRLVRFLSLLR